MTPCSSLCIVTVYKLEDRVIVVRFLAGTRDVILHRNIRTNSSPPNRPVHVSPGFLPPQKRGRSVKMTTNYIEIEMRAAVPPFHDTVLNTTHVKIFNGEVSNSCGGSHELTLFWKVTSCCLVEIFRHFVRASENFNQTSRRHIPGQ